MAQNNLTLEQKLVTLTIAMGFVDDDHPQKMTILEDVMDDLGITREQVVHNDSFFDKSEPEALKSLSPSDKKVVQRILTKTFNRGGYGSNIEMKITFNQWLERCGIPNTGTSLSQIVNVILDSSVKSIEYTAACHLSSIMSMGINTAKNTTVRIYSDRIDFGRFQDEDCSGFSGLLFANFSIEDGNIVYRFGNNLQCEWFSKRIIYKGTEMRPTSPDNQEMFNIIYPRFK